MSNKQMPNWQALKKWWQGLDTTASDHADGNFRSNRGVRAELRRCRTSDEVLLCAGFYQARDLMKRDGVELNDDKLATVVGLIVWIEQDNKESRFGRLLRGSGDARFSDLRFRRLIEARDHAELYRRLRPAIDLLGRSVNVEQFAQDVYFWSPKTENPVRRRWAEDYYSQQENH